MSDYLSRINRGARRRDHVRVLAAVAGAIAFVGVVAAFPVYGITWSNTHESHQGCTVDDKDRASKKDGGSDMRVYTSCGVFSVADDVIVGQWNSADIFSRIEVGRTYDLGTVGWRNGLLSSFPNIVSIAPSS